ATGLVKVNGENVFDDVPAVHRQTAYLPESANLYPHLSALENLEYLLSLAGVNLSTADIHQALDTVNLQSAARDKRLNSYSKGMRQKVAIALAILRKTPILLLDEPTSGLDPVAIDEFNTILIELAGAGTSVLMVTHDVYGACHVANRVGLLQKGKMVGLFEAPEGGQISAEEVHQTFIEHHR
ncbi:MAG: ATP-binding cassette domain-containing protein, partial [Pseudomonadales bacterium]